MAEDVWVPNWTVRRFTDPKSFLANANMVGCAHTIVGSYSSGWNFGNIDGKPYAQSYIRGSGEGVNAWPVNLRGAANLEGNPYVWAIETEDLNPLYFPSWNLRCGEVPAWTDGQVETLIEGLAWWCIRYNRPPALIPDTKPGRVGLAYHRQGVPGSPEWVTGADQWTRSVGKCCPDWRRIHQFKTEVVPGVAALVDSVLHPPTPIEEDDDMKDWILRAPDRSPAVVRGETVILIVNASSIDSLKKNGGAVEVPLTTPDYDRIVAGLNAPELVDDVSIPNP